MVRDFFVKKTPIGHRIAADRAVHHFHYIHLFSPCTMHPATLRTTRSRRSVLRNRQSRSRLSPWTAWQMATSRQLTAARLHVTSLGHACTNQVPNAGHNLPQEAPDAFASAVLELANLRSHSAGV